MKFTIKEIIEATGAKIISGNEIDGEFSISTDTRTIKEGEIYLPLRGENFDGQTFIDSAVEKGIAGYFTQDNRKINKNVKFVLSVENSLIAFLDLAHYIRNKINPKVIAITGSSGKTTVKEMMACVLETTFKTHKSKLNHNNEIGLCETMFLMPKDTETVVVELGMRNLGEIDLLGKFVEPNIGIITNIGSAHVERLGSIDNIATAKCEIINHIRQDGFFISNDNEKIKSKANFDGEKLYYSIKNADEINIKEGYSSFVFEGEKYELRLEGEHNIENAILVIKTAQKLGISTDKIKKGLLNFHQIEKRWEITKTQDLTLINDSYNANPESMKAVLKTFLSVYKNNSVYLILGDMAELGRDEIKYHKKLGEFLNKYPYAKLLTVGSLARFIGQNTKINSKHFQTHKECADFIVNNCEKGSVLLFKASRVMQFEKIIKEIENYDND